MSFVRRISVSSELLRRSACRLANRQEPVGTARRNSWHLLHQPSHLKNNAATAAAGVRFLSSNYHGFRNPGARISETSVFMQDGAKISEVPLIVKKVKDIFELYRRMDIKQTMCELQPTEKEKDDFIIVFPDNIAEDEMEIISGFNRCFNSASIFRLLETIPRQEVTPLVAVHALRKIIDLENSFEMRNPGSTRETIRGTRRTGQDTFLRMAFMTMLLDIVCGSRKPAVILDGLTTVMRDQFPADLATYKERLLEELLLCVTEGIFSVTEVCRAINILSMFYEDRKKCLEVADKLWCGIADLHKQIDNPDAVAAVFSTLPNLNKSRSIIIKIIEKKAMNVWEQYDTGHIIEIMRVLTELKYDKISPDILKMISQWLALNIHKVKESEMLAIVYSFMQLEYVDDRLINTMEKVIKLKGCQIQEIDLVSTFCNVCTHFRIRSPYILEGVSEYFVHNVDKLTVPQIYAMARIFGELDFYPTTGFKFWKELENVLEQKFIQFRPKEIIDLMVSFLYIQKYPLNFKNRLFNPNFLDRIHSQAGPDVIHSRQQLKLFDAGMTLESKGYGGPYLPKDPTYLKLNRDHRLMKMSDKLFSPLGEAIGDFSRVGSNILLSSLPTHENFIVDLMIYPSRAAALLRFGFETENSSNIAVLVNMPEHYDRTHTHLTGNQLLRIRHLNIMGFRVMTLDFTKLKKIINKPDILQNYLREEYNQVVDKGKKK
eukprot:TRINITY_DN1279_c0_g1_i4.p1 TRINITY_DN1279_c0_g1~~TRINITY_DN1279_c0_g1_i4.p1  ORF type:complete len:716 (+),score=170.02 TRINITY_DN1279_c0_g1_i4:592-2739(+)